MFEKVIQTFKREVKNFYKHSFLVLHLKTISTMLPAPCKVKIEFNQIKSIVRQNISRTQIVVTNS